MPTSSLPRIQIRFGHSTSQNFPEALRLAQKLPGYRSSNLGKGRAETHQIDFAPGEDRGKELDGLVSLLRVISSWKSATLRLNGEPVPYMWGFLNSLSQAASCYRSRTQTTWPDDYCLGKKAPTDEQLHFGCRYEKGVEFNTSGYGSTPKWYQFGKLSEDCQSFSPSKEEILARLQFMTNKEACVFCPAFSWERIRRSLELIPERIDLATDDRFELSHSEMDPTRPLGIQRKRPDFTHAYSIRLSRNDHPTAAGADESRRVPAVKYTDVAGQDRALAEIENIVGLPLKHPEYFAAVGVDPHRGILLYGPPGNGKTLIARAVAGEANAHFEIINGPEILSKWVGQSEENLRRIFERATRFAPSIVLIDEIDAIAPTRDRMTHHHDVTLISQLLVLLDGLRSRGAVTVIASTNRLDAIDPAIRRPGRFDYHVEVGLPDTAGRIAIMTVHLCKMKSKMPEHMEVTADKTEGFSGAELAAVCREAGLLAIKRAISQAMAPADLVVDEADVLRAIEEITTKRRFTNGRL